MFSLQHLISVIVVAYVAVPDVINVGVLILSNLINLIWTGALSTLTGQNLLEFYLF